MEEDLSFRESIMFHHAIQTTIDFVRCGLSGGVRRNPLDFVPVIQSTSAQGQEFAKSIRTCDRVSVYLDCFGDGGVVIQISVHHTKPKRFRSVWQYVAYENGEVYEKSFKTVDDITPRKRKKTGAGNKGRLHPHPGIVTSSYRLGEQ